MMSSADFKQSLMNLDVDTLSNNQIKNVKAIVKDEDFTVQRMKEISSAGAGLLYFIIAVLGYSDVAREIQPKRTAVAKLEQDLLVSQEEYEKITQELKVLKEELSNLQLKLHDAQRQQKELQDIAEVMKRRSQAAEKLITGLASERNRWTLEYNELIDMKRKLYGDCLLAAGFLSYCGPLTWEYRHELIYARWIPEIESNNLSLNKEFKIQNFLSSDSEVSQWSGEGLPSDELSVQNGILTTKGSKFPICIDAQKQAVQWIRKKESSNGLKISSFTDNDFLKSLELAISYGFPFLIEGVDDSVDSVIENVLEKRIQVNGARKYVVLGDKEVDYDPSFRLYLATKNSNPSFDAKTFGSASIINYSLTLKGLSDQLLNVVVAHEKKELEIQKELLVQEMSKNTVLLKELEDSLLKELANSKGSMLDNTDLIQKLEETKSKAAEIGLKLDTAKRTSSEVEAARNEYRPVAQTGAVLYFVLSGLSNISRMYEFSLESYLAVFKQSLIGSKSDSVVSRRLTKIAEHLKVSVYNYGCSGIFEKHKLLFALQMTLKLLENDELLSASEVDFFVKGNVSLDSSIRDPAPFTWLSEQSYSNFVKFCSIIEDGKIILNDVKSNEILWRDWVQSESPELIPPPSSFSLTDFQLLCLVRCFRIDRVPSAVTAFISKQMGQKFVTPPVINFRGIYNQTSFAIPTLFILSPGADPLSDIQKLAYDLNFDAEKILIVSLGQGQGPVVLQLFDRALKEGCWLVLQNCHLLLPFMKTLEKSFERMKFAHEEFRLWITTEPTDDFPIEILLKCLKVVIEPPSGLKLNVRSIISRLTEEDLSVCKHPAYRPLTFSLGFLHAVLQERRKYGKIGWNVNYDFNESDFRVSHTILKLYLEKQFAEKDSNEIPWKTLINLIGDIMYGGRVIDSFDQRVLMTYLSEYLGDFCLDEYQQFCFYKSDKVEYRLPKQCARDDLLKEIDTYPLVNSPEVFGLHQSAELGYLSDSAKNLFAHLLALQPRTIEIISGSQGDDQLSLTVNNLLARIPEPFDVPVVRKSIGTPSPVHVVLFQELERWNQLVKVIKTSLKELLRALRGEVGMSQSLDELSSSLNVGRLPSEWATLAPQTMMSLVNWMRHFEKRYLQYSSWISAGEPKVMWLSGLHIPEQYLTAQMQVACRKNSWPLDKATLFTKVTSYMSSDGEMPPPSQAGFYISGLYLEGASWDKEKSHLQEQRQERDLSKNYP